MCLIIVAVSIKINSLGGMQEITENAECAFLIIPRDVHVRLNQIGFISVCFIYLINLFNISPTYKLLFLFINFKQIFLINIKFLYPLF